MRIWIAPGPTASGAASVTACRASSLIMRAFASGMLASTAWLTQSSRRSRTVATSALARAWMSPSRRTAAASEEISFR